VIFDDGRGSVFSGRATVARVTAAGLVNVRLVDTGPLPSSGGIREEELLNLNLLGILQSGTARAITRLPQLNLGFADFSPTWFCNALIF